jgi:Smg protein
MFYEKVIEIIVLLLDELKSNKQLGEADVQKLAKLGYTQNEINTAFSWIYSKINSGDNILYKDSSEKRSHRVLHEVEKNVISPDAFGYVIQMRELGLLNDNEIEDLIDKIMASGFMKITLEDMKSFIAGYLLDIDEMTNTNKRIMLNTNDTIN